MRDYSKLLEIAKQNNGIVQTKVAVANNIPKDYLKYAVQDKVLEKVRNGIYITSNTMTDELYYLQLKAKNLIYSYDTSAYYNELTTRDSLRVSITTTRDNNVSSLKSSYDLDFHFVSEESLKLGLIEKKTMFGNLIKIYDKERTICDLFSNRFYGDKFIAVESLKAYLRCKDKNISKLMSYAKTLGVEKQLREKLEVLL